VFDYLSDKVCTRLLQYFASRTNAGGSVLVTNVHSANPQKVLMEHLLEWHLIYRDEAQVESLLPLPGADRRIYTDETGANVFADLAVPKKLD
jgi:extracellular factor (EF) 3-hydroxypalmitic acid methyl ester biosynthesis protein